MKSPHKTAASRSGSESRWRRRTRSTASLNAIHDQLEDAVSVVDAFHIGKLGSQVFDEVRRRVQQAIRPHRGRRDDPLDGIRNVLRCAEERLPIANANDSRRR